MVVLGCFLSGGLVGCSCLSLGCFVIVLSLSVVVLVPTVFLSLVVFLSKLSTKLPLTGWAGRSIFIPIPGFSTAPSNPKFCCIWWGCWPTNSSCLPFGCTNLFLTIWAAPAAPPSPSCWWWGGWWSGWAPAPSRWASGWCWGLVLTRLFLLLAWGFPSLFPD